MFGILSHRSLASGISLTPCHGYFDSFKVFLEHSQWSDASGGLIEIDLYGFLGRGGTNTCSSMGVNQILIIVLCPFRKPEQEGHFPICGAGSGVLDFVDDVDFLLAYCVV